MRSSADNDELNLREYGSIDYMSSVEDQLREISDRIVNELITLTPESMNQIQFEIISTDDDGADFGLMKNHPDAIHVRLSETIYQATSAYVPLVKKYISGWHRSQITITKSNGSWDVVMNFEKS